MKKAALVFKILFFISVGFLGASAVFLVIGGALAALTGGFGGLIMGIGFIMFIPSVLGFEVFLPLWLVFRGITRKKERIAQGTYTPKSEKKRIKKESKALKSMEKELSGDIKALEAEIKEDKKSAKKQEKAEKKAQKEAKRLDEAQALQSAYENGNPALGDRYNINLDSFTVYEQRTYTDQKEFKFASCDGFLGSTLRKFSQRYLLACPYCQTRTPSWEMAQVNFTELRGMITFFKCSECQGVVNVSVPDIRTAMTFNPADSVVAGNLIYKKSTNREPRTPYITFDSVGNSGVNPDILGKEIRAQDMQAVAFR